MDRRRRAPTAAGMTSGAVYLIVVSTVAARTRVRVRVRVRESDAFWQVPPPPPPPLLPPHPPAVRISISDVQISISVREQATETVRTDALVRNLIFQSAYILAHDDL